MKNKFILCLIFTIFCASVTLADTKDFKISNKFFSITIPSIAKDSYVAKKKKNSIAIYDKDSMNAGFGGFAFAIIAYKTPSEHAMSIGSRKIGELVKNNALYDIVIARPTDVQYDYTLKSEPRSYRYLYNLGNTVEIEGTKKATYFKDQGMKGKDLYQEVLNKHRTAIKEKWDSIKLEDENMSYMYNVLSSGGADVLNKVGYAYYDVNADGIDELLIGEIGTGSWKGVIYDIYTMVNRKPTHVISGGTRDRYYVCDDVFICREYSSGALESGVDVYNLVENSTELFPQVSFKYDGYTNSKKPWFLSYGSDINKEEWNNVDEKTFKDRKKVFEKYKRFNFTPLK